jgi:hypothetical protein
MFSKKFKKWTLELHGSHACVLHPFYYWPVNKCLIADRLPNMTFCHFCGPARDTVLTNWQTEKFNFDTNYTGCIKKKVIELQRAIVSELLCVWTRFFHIQKDHAFSYWMISSSCQMDKKWANTNPIKNVSQNRIFSPLRVESKTIENESPLVLKLMNFTSIIKRRTYS